MSEVNILEKLSSLEFFHGIGIERLEKLAKIARLVEFPANTSIFLENDVAKDMYLIISGQVSLVICQPHVGCRQLMEVRAGDLIGWSPLVSRPRLSDTARTLSRTSAIALDGEQVLDFCAEDSQFGFEFMSRVAHVLAERLSATRMKLLEMSGLQLPELQLEQLESD